MGLSKILEKIADVFYYLSPSRCQVQNTQKKLGKDNFLCCYGRFKKFQKVLLEGLACHDWTNKSGSSKGRVTSRTVFSEKNPLRLMQVFTTDLEIWKTMTKISSE